MDELWRKHKIIVLLLAALVLYKLIEVSYLAYTTHRAFAALDALTNMGQPPSSVVSPISPVASTQTSSQQVQSVTVSPEQFASDFAANDVRAKDFYIGKKIIMTAQVLAVVDQSDGGASVAFQVNDNTYLPKTLQFNYPRDFRSAIAGLSRGQTVTCEGFWKDSAWSFGDYHFDGTALY
jgi:hypothetical protein